MKKLLNTKEACEYLGILKLGTLYSYISSGQLKAHKLGGNGNSRRHWRIKVEDLEDFINGKTAEPVHTEASK